MALVRRPEAVAAGDPERWAAVAVMSGLFDTTDPDTSLERLKEVISDGGIAALEGHLRAEGTWDAWVAKLEGGEDSA